jgi:hypothetical protein
MDCLLKNKKFSRIVEIQGKRQKSENSAHTVAFPERPGHELNQGRVAAHFSISPGGGAVGSCVPVRAQVPDLSHKHIAGQRLRLAFD